MNKEYHFDWSKIPFESPIPDDYYEECVFPELLEQLQKRLEKDRIGVSFLKIALNLCKECRIMKDGHSVLTDVSVVYLKALRNYIAPYRGMVEELNEYRRKRYQFPEELRSFYDVAHDIIGLCDSLPQDASPEDYPPHYSSDDLSEKALYGKSFVDKILGITKSKKDTIIKYRPQTFFNMSELYKFLIDEGVVVDADEKQFADCIFQANIKPLWEKTRSKNKFKLALITLKWFFQDSAQRQRRIHPTWYLKCCDSIVMITQEMSKMKFKESTKVKFCEKIMSCV